MRTRYRDEESPPEGKEYLQDGDSVLANEGECLLEVNLSGRYYGVDYERGNIIVYCAVAEWLEQNIEGCEVWYGGDSSGVLARKFDAAERNRLKAHLYSKDGRDYFQEYGGMPTNNGKPPPCSLCPGGKYRGSQYGFGGNGSYAAFSCAGCGKSIETRDSCKTWQEENRT